LGNGIIKDNVTDLMWQKATAQDYHTWEQALSYCDNLTLGGYTDWRLPTIKELSTLVDSGTAYPGPAINMSYFPDTGARSNYWSSTASVSTYVGDADSAWHVYFGNGAALFDKKGNSYHVRAVRGVSSSNNFVDNSDETITDTSTGLMWSKSAGASFGFPDAQQQCEYLSKSGHSDWRLPTRNELQTIVDYNRTISTYPAFDTNYFELNIYGLYQWSSTTYAFDTHEVWCIDFHEGGIYHTKKTTSPPPSFRPVRAGQCIASTTTTTLTTTTTAPFRLCPARQILGNDNPNLIILRVFRDSRLAQSTVGRKVIQIYYNNADSINDALERSPALRAVTRRMVEVITPLIGNKE